MPRNTHGLLRIAAITLITIATAFSSAPFLPRNETGGLIGPRIAQAEEQFQVITPAQIDRSAPELVNPMRGLYRWRGSENVPSPNPLPRRSFDAYQRYEWRDLERGRGEYDFTALERDLQRAADAGQKFGFRIRAYVPRQGSSVPDYVMDDMELGWWTDLDRDGDKETYVPDWNDEDFLAGVERLMNALGERYDNDPRVSYLDIGIFGSYGEWHTSGLNYSSSNPARTMTRPNREKIIEYHLAAFPNTHLLMMTDDERSLAYALQLSPRIGWRRDSLGVDHFNTAARDLERLGPEELALFEERWKTAPVVTEFMQPKYHESPGTYELAREQVERYHVSMIGNGNMISWGSLSSAGRSAVVEMAKSSGYRIALAELTLPATLRTGELTMLTGEWVNQGVAPTYEDWQVWYQLRDGAGAVAWEGPSQIKLRELLPSAEFGPQTASDELILPTSLAPGSYSLSVVVRDPEAYRQPLFLSIDGRQEDGSYLLGEVELLEGRPDNIALQNQIYLPALSR